MEFETSNHIKERLTEQFRHKVMILHLLVILGLFFYVIGSMTVYGYLAFLGVMAFFLKDDITFREAVGFRKKMSLSAFLMLIPLSLMMHLMIVVFGSILSPIFSEFGWNVPTMQEFFLDSTGEFTPTPFGDVLQSGFVAPLLEEIICRGYLMGMYYKISGSKMHAIICSSIIFAFMHADFVCTVPFFFGGVVMAYAAMEYGIVWSAVYHSINNFLIAEVLNFRILASMPEEKRFPIYFAMSLFMAVCSVVILIVKRKEVHEYISENVCEREQFMLTVKSVPFIIFVGLMVIIMLKKIDAFV